MNFGNVNSLNNDDQSTGSAIGMKLNSTQFLGLVGLRNIGNTCFMNSALQIVLNMYFIISLISSFRHPFTRLFYARAQTLSPASHVPLSKAYLKLLLDMGHLDEKFQASNGRCLPVRGDATPSRILDIMRKTHPIFRGLSQQDSQEFLRAFLGDLHEELKLIPFNESKYPLPLGSSVCSEFIRDSFHSVCHFASLLVLERL